MGEFQDGAPDAGHTENVRECGLKSFHRQNFVQISHLKMISSRDQFLPYACFTQSNQPRHSQAKITYMYGE